MHLNAQPSESTLLVNNDDHDGTPMFPQPSTWNMINYQNQLTISSVFWFGNLYPGLNRCHRQFVQSFDLHRWPSLRYFFLNGVCVWKRANLNLDLTSLFNFIRQPEY